MDAEWEKQFEEHRKRLKEIAVLAHEHLGDDPDKVADIVNKIQSVVKESVPVITEASKLSNIVKNVVREVDRSQDFKTIQVNEVYEQESAKEIPVPSYNYEQEFHEFVSALKHGTEDSLIISQQREGEALDPWTKRPIKKPMTSKLCGHVFDKSSIQTVTQKKRDFRCPYIGCKSRITLNDLEED